MPEFIPDRPADEVEHEPWNNLTAAQKRVARAIAFITGPGIFDRPALEEQTRNSNTISDIVDDKNRLLTSLSYTTLLNALTERGYLQKISQGGQNPVVFDIRPDEDQSVQAAPFGATAELLELAEIVLEREGQPLSVLDQVDTENVNEIIRTVNDQVEGRVLAITADPSRYGIAVSTCRTIVENSIDALGTSTIAVELFHEYETIEYSMPNYKLEATIESISEGVVNFVITIEDEYIDEAYVLSENYDEPFEINNAFDVVYLSDESVYLIADPARSEEIKEEVQEIMSTFQQQVISVEEWEEE